MPPHALSTLLYPFQIHTCSWRMSSTTLVWLLRFSVDSQKSDLDYNFYDPTLFTDMRQKYCEPGAYCFQFTSFRNDNVKTIHQGEDPRGPGTKLIFFSYSLQERCPRAVVSKLWCSTQSPGELVRITNPQLYLVRPGNS